MPDKQDGSLHYQFLIYHLKTLPKKLANQEYWTRDPVDKTIDEQPYQKNCKKLYIVVFRNHLRAWRKMERSWNKNSIDRTSGNYTKPPSQVIKVRHTGFTANNCTRGSSPNANFESNPGKIT